MIYCEICEGLMSDDTEVVNGKFACEYCYKEKKLTGSYLVSVMDSISARTVKHTQVSAETLQEGLDNGGLSVYKNRREKILFFFPEKTLDEQTVTMGGRYGCE